MIEKADESVLLEIGQVLADVAEDLAIEILDQFTEEDYRHLTKSILRLEAAAQQLTKVGIATPFFVENVLHNYRSSIQNGN